MQILIILVVYGSFALSISRGILEDIGSLYKGGLILSNGVEVAAFSHCLLFFTICQVTNLKTRIVLAFFIWFYGFFFLG
jgi:hypothetical protein